MAYCSSFGACGGIAPCGQNGGHHGGHTCGCHKHDAPCGLQPYACPLHACNGFGSSNPYAQPILCSAAQYSSAGIENGATLVIHKIVLEACGTQSCTPRTFNIRITGPSYPCGEIFQLRAGNCLELDEPLVITGLEPGTYCIEELFTNPNEYVSTYTGPICGQQVTLTNSWSPTVVTIVNRRRLCRLCHGYGCGCSACSIC